jgi:hypothetical protein
MKLMVQVDAAGWFPSDPWQSPPLWHSVTGDEMRILAGRLGAGFPKLSDLTIVRRHFQDETRKRGGALISCDVVQVGGSWMVRTVRKQRSGRARAMAYAGSLILSVVNSAVEVIISGSEDNVTGVREAIVASELLRAAGPSERAQLAQNKIPIEWSFERYEPRTRGDLAYLLSDDEKWDARFPNHALSRVRRWLRRQERGFEVTVTEASDPEQARIDVMHLAVKPMDFNEALRELGHEVAYDAVLPEVLRGLKPPIALPPLPERQKKCREQRDAAMKKTLEQHQQREAELKRVRENTEALWKELQCDKTHLALARERGSGEWHMIQEGAQAGVLAVFTSKALVEDFIACKALDCEPVMTSVRDLFTSLSESRLGPVTAVEFDRCPRCTDARPVLQLSAIHGEGELLKQYAARVATRNFLVEKNLRVAQSEPDAAKRLGVLKYTAEHIDPGAAALHVEIAALEQARGNTA